MAPIKTLIHKASLQQKAPPSSQLQQAKDNEKILEALKKQTETIIESIRAEFNATLKGLKRETYSLMLEITEQTEQLIETTDQIREEIEEVKDDMEYKVAMMEEKIAEEATMQQFKEMEYALRLRGLREDPQEDLMEIFLEAMYVNVDLQPDELQDNIEKIYRVNSAIAKQRNLPRDVVVYFTRRSIRNGILRAYFQNNFEIANQKIMMLKEIPSRMLKKRREYNFLTQELRNRQIWYRWEIPQGLTVFYQNKRYKVKTVVEAKNLLKLLGEEAPLISLGLEETTIERYASRA